MRSERKEFIITEEEIKIIRARRRRLKRRSRKINKIKKRLTDFMEHVKSFMTTSRIAGMAILLLGATMLMDCWASPDNGELNFTYLLLCIVGFALFLAPKSAFESES